MSILLNGTTGISVSGNITAGGDLAVGGSFAPQTVSTTGNVTGGNVLTAGQVSATGNVSGNYILGNGALLTGISGGGGNAGSITNGTSNVNIATANGNITMAVGGAQKLEIAPTVITVTGNLLPEANVTYNLGSPTRQWRDVYVGPGSLYINNQKVLEDNSGTIIVSADNNQNLSLQTSGTGDIEFAPQATGIISIKGTTQFDPAYSIGTTNGEALPISSGVKTDIITARTANTNLSLSGSGTGHVNVSGDMAVSGNLTVTGNAANLSVTNLSVQDNIINIAAETTGTPTQNAGLQVIRGDDPNVQLRWNEAGRVWQFTVDGLNYQTIVGSLAGVLSVTGNVSSGNLITAGLVNAGSLTTSGNAIIGGDLVVNGNTTSINITDLNVEDPIIGLGRGANNQPLTADDGKDRGEQLWYYDGAERSAFLGWDDSAGKLIAAANVSIANEIVTVNSYGTFVVGALEGTAISVTGNVAAAQFNGSGAGLTAVPGANVTGTVANATFATSAASATTAATVTGAEQANITSVGTLSALSVTGNVTGGNVRTAGLISATGNVTGNYILGNGALLTGISGGGGGNASSITNGTSNVNIATANGNITMAVGGTQLLEITSAGASVTGNITGNYILGNGSLLTGISGGGAATPRVANCQIANSSWTVLDDTAVALSGGYVILNGAGFVAGANVIIGSVAAAAVTVVNSTTIRAQVNAAAAGTYVIYVVNPDGSVGILVNGLTYSATPTWVTGSTLAQQLSNVAISIQLAATGANVYALSAGNSLPDGLSLSSGGLLSGTVTVAQQTVYSFSVDAIDTELQDSPRTFNLTIATAAVDPYFEYVSLLLHGDGANTAQNNTFVDSSSSNFPINRFGDATQGTNSPFSRSDGNWSNYFDGDGDYLTWSGTTLSGNFTVECWVYKTAVDASGYTILFYGGGNDQFSIDQTTAGSIALVIGANTIISASGTAVTPNAWHHLAWVREGTTCRAYVDGVQQGTGTSAASFTLTTIGRYGLGGYEMNGYISNFRITNACLYPSGTTFTPSTTPLTTTVSTGTVQLLTCQSNRFKDNSTNNFALTVNGNTSVQVFDPFNPPDFYQAANNGGSALFDGSGDYLTVNGNSVLNVGNSDYTIEFWMYMNSAPNDYCILFSYTQSGMTTGIRLSNSGFGLKLQFGPFLESLGGLYSIALIQQDFVGRWRHVAMTRSSNSLRLFIDGQLQSFGTGVNPSTYPNTSITDNTSLTTSSSCQVVQDNFPGYISGLRVVKNTALYTSSFTPPTTPPTAVSGTSLLLNFVNAGIYDNAGMNDIVTVGNAQVRTNIKKYGTGSMYFDGTDDRLTMQASPNFAFGTGDFTIEFWMYSNDVSISRQRGMMQSSTTTGGLSTSYSAGILFAQGINGSNQGLTGGLIFNILGTVVGNVSAVLTTSTWYHIAATRQSGTVRLFVDGVLMDTETQAGSVDAQNLCIGGYYSTSYLYDGYIDDLRITKGYARYTANFTPPDAALPDF